MCPPPDSGTLRVYSRPGCHLCELLLDALIPLVRDRLRIDIVDISGDTTLEATYGQRIPVVEFDGELVCQYRLDRPAIGALLANRAAPRD